MSGVGGIGGGAGGIQQILAMRQQIIDRTNLLQQVKDAKATGAAGAATETAGTQQGEGFAGALKSALDGVSATQQKAEDLSAGYERGEVTDIAKVMLARQEAGVAFEATLQVRNRLLSAYQDIMRMGV
ncbi:flagellar hook-basal body complex protein FliE [Novosphingobium flavum]|uniref:Flagellar hook-basal body complex protein FliE n=1 Tax=Novosphingobium flavum TaxID=1778672 RepID=A0A7X1FS46_9SPHN|nr:flagellar hook-basal body complex protein FliE [Novosphingobium flavum]MBC2665956.1 flagellar hook-basal body complex protein FliE [Novosphingobium flavum]